MMNESKISRSLIIGAMLVAATRYVGVFAHSEGWQIAGDVWQWLVALSGLGMAVLEGVAVWYCWQAWSNAKPSGERNFLLWLIVAMFITLGVMVVPYTYAASHKKLTVEALGDWLQVLWSVAVSVAPLVVMAAAGLADKLRPAGLQDEQGEANYTALVSQAVAGAMGALKPEFERVAQMSDDTATEVARVQRDMAREVAELQRGVKLVFDQVAELHNLPRPVVAPVAQLAGGLQWSADNLRAVVAQNPEIGATEAIALFANPPSRQAVAKALSKLREPIA
jgi:hypothetical protein